MDAISFVFGLPAKYLRGKQLKDLIYSAGASTAGGHPDTTDAARRASVKVIYTLDDDECTDLELPQGTPEIEFARVINADGTSTYRVGRDQVKWEVYKETLAKLRIMVSARNFLVFQVRRSHKHSRCLLLLR
jgi:chromosome segregation ATPase